MTHMCPDPLVLASSVMVSAWKPPRAGLSPVSPPGPALSPERGQRRRCLERGH